MTQPTRKIFISYRTADNAEFVHRIRDWLMQRYGRDHVFMDFDNLPPLSRFEDYIKARILESDAVLVIIGPDWLRLLNEKAADGDKDYVKIEVETALSLPNVIVAPVCIKNAPMPNRRDLPESLRAMCDINAARLDSGRAFYDEIARLMDAIEGLMRPASPPLATPGAAKKPGIEIYEPPLETAREYMQRAYKRNESGDYEGVIADCNAALRLDPKYDRAYNSRGLARNKLGDHAGAIADYDQMLRLDPNSAVAYHNRGNARDALGDHAGAIADYDQAIRLDPKYALAYYNRGVSYQHTGMYAEASADFRRFLRSDDPRNRDQAEAYIRENDARMRRA
jgi:tetratricopeptide (TPR) repeat protein